jgi:hypothetical protein
MFTTAGKVGFNKEANPVESPGESLAALLERRRKAGTVRELPKIGWTIREAISATVAIPAMSNTAISAMAVAEWRI